MISLSDPAFRRSRAPCRSRRPAYHPDSRAGGAGRVHRLQGERELRRRNWAPFPVPEREIDAVVLSHAHLDHCGWLPRLVRNGYAGPVYCFAVDRTPVC